LDKTEWDRFAGFEIQALAVERLPPVVVKATRGSGNPVAWFAGSAEDLQIADSDLPLEVGRTQASFGKFVDCQRLERPLFAKPHPAVEKWTEGLDAALGTAKGPFRAGGRNGHRLNLARLDIDNQRGSWQELSEAGRIRGVDMQRIVFERVGRRAKPSDRQRRQ